ncbi:3-hydroxyacyl-CoA dehydrogenase NAD-binding domain-containing protein [Lentibacillus sp. CBA3610]|uniref:3-hydroxyacyl-CoA dehydrogenase NAD-binding domain-containing protein n=1 Tax=Lentibacillus sp. CBA3610 TaxID=2518176 RepID=UPI00159631E0|nr:3-hydroxyacyl-CoA dehydrogenase NAD-binding domain-containing protein [Lentibacillus sp. CBA3610]QKY69636.1 3-hydroxyacyl-CoA dehydrogenase [Lentibacillus sp. CBA3610]
MVKHIAVIGSGTMGRGIAYQAALAGFFIHLQDISEQSIENAKAYIQSLAKKSADKGYINIEQKKIINENITYTLDLQEAVKRKDLVIEAVIEKMDVKIDVFKQVNEAGPGNAILATNTSTMSPTEIGATTKQPDKFVAMHFFNPVHRMKLIEIIRGMDTSDETVEVINTVAEKMGKETVEVNEFPGFVTSRMNCIIGNEAMNMLMEGVASAEDIDKGIKLGLNHPMGPLEMADLVGLDSRLRNMEYLYYHLGEKYRPSPILTKYVKSGRLGRKSGHGFYDYE